MTDNELFKLIIAALQPLQIPVVQKNQPESQGTPTTPAFFIEKIADKTVGWPQSEMTYVAPVKTAPVKDGGFVEREYQHYDTTIQISCLCDQDPKDTSKPTASDLLLKAVAILQSRKLIREWSSKGANMYRVINSIRNEYFVDDQVQYEAIPSFDLMISHRRYNDNFVGEITAADVTRVIPVKG